MAVRFDITALLAAALILGCTEEGSPQSPDGLDDDDDTTEETNSSSTDAGGKKDSGGGKKDAASDDDDDDSADDDSADDDSDDDDAADDDTGDDDDDTGTMSDAGTSPSNDAGKSDSGGGSADSGSAACNSVTYSNFGMAFFDSYCTSCHGGAEPMADVSLESLDDVSEHKADIIDRAVTKKNMPPRGSKQPPAADLTKLKSWLDCGPK